MSEPIAYGKALYYPHIHFQNNKWLKSAALYYDSLYRMVPDGFATKDNETVKALIDECGFVANLETRGESEEIAAPFLSYLQKEFPDDVHRELLFKKLGEQVVGKAPLSIHMYKMGQLLRDQLPKLHLADEPTENEPEFYTFEPATAAIYMTYLANHMAEQRKLPVITDNAFYHPLIQGMQADVNRTDVAEKLARIVIETVVPDSLEELPVEKIVKFRHKHKDERLLFYQSVNEMVKGMRDVTNQQDLADMLHQKEQLINIAAENLRRSYRSVGISASTGLLTLSVPAIVSGAGALAAGLVVGALAVAKTIGAAVDYRKTKMASPHAYVLSLGTLNKESFMDQMLKGELLF